METWAKTSLILCVFGFLSEFRPIEPYYIQYMVGPSKNFTEVQINQESYPVVTYSQLSLLVLVFLLTDMLRYKPVILLLVITLFISTVVTLVGETIEIMKLNSFFYGTFLASTVAYFTYIYAQVDKKYYQKVTSHTQVAILLGRFSSSVTGQILISTGFTDLLMHNYLSIGAVFLAMVWAFFLPSVERSIYFHADQKNIIVENVPDPDLDIPSNKTYTTLVLDGAAASGQPSIFSDKCARAFKHLWDDFKYAYTNLYVVKWCTWWAVATCGYYQIVFYIQILWETVNNEDPESKSDLQGVVYAAYTVIGAAGSFVCGWLHFNWRVLGDTSMAVTAFLQGAAIIAAAYATNIWVAYMGFIIFAALYHTMITIVNSEIAKHINEDSYGLVFGVNTFFSLVIQTILTVAVAGEGGLALAVRPQFLVYGGFFVVLGAIFAVMAVISLYNTKLWDQPLWISKVPSIANS